MFRQVEIEVFVGEVVSFRFSIPLSVITLMVINTKKETQWEFIADEFRPVKIVEEGFEPAPNQTDEFIPVLDAKFKTWKLEEAPPALLDMLALLQDREDARLREEGPRKPPVENVVYGQLPAGYREKQLANPLGPGNYTLIVFAEQGQGSASFGVAGA